METPPESLPAASSDDSSLISSTTTSDCSQPGCPICKKNIADLADFEGEEGEKMETGKEQEASPSVYPSLLVSIPISGSSTPAPANAGVCEGGPDKGIDNSNDESAIAEGGIDNSIGEAAIGADQLETSIDIDDILQFDWSPVSSIEPADWADLDEDEESVLKRMASAEEDGVWQADDSPTAQKLREVATKEIVAVPQEVVLSASRPDRRK